MPEDSAVSNAVVIGGGLAGLAAAMRLKEHGIRNVTLLEREDHFGGLAISLRFEGLNSDLGPHRFFTEIPEVNQFYREIGGPAYMSVRRKSSIFLGGQFLHYPLRVRDLLKGPGIKRVAGFGLSWLRTRLFDRKATAGSNFETFMRKAFGGAIYEYLVGPYTKKVWKTDPRDLDADAARVRVSAGSLLKMVRGMFLREKAGKQTALKEFHYMKGGAQTLVNFLVERAHVANARLLTRHPLEGFDYDESGAITAVRARYGEEVKTFPADRVVSTIPLPQLFRAVNQSKPLDEQAAQGVEDLRYLDVVFVFVLVERDEIRGDQWIYFPESQFIFNRASESKAFDPQMGQSGRSILCVEVTCRRGDEFWNLPDEAITSQVLPQLYQTGIFEEKDILGAYVHRLSYAYPIYDLDYSRRVEAALKELARVPNLVTTGRQGLFSFNNMDHSIYMGMKAADCAASSERPAARWLTEHEQFHNFRIVD